MTDVPAPHADAIRQRGDIGPGASGSGAAGDCAQEMDVPTMLLGDSLAVGKGRTGRWLDRYSAPDYPSECLEFALPRIPDQLLHSVVYFYPSPEDATAGRAFGGT